MRYENTIVANLGRSPSERVAQVFCLAPPLFAIANGLVPCSITGLLFMSALALSAVTTALRGIFGRNWTGGSRYVITSWLGTLACFATLH